MNFAWSFSGNSMHDLCPKKYFHIRVAKDFKDEDSAESDEGKIIHKVLHRRVIDGVALPLQQRHFEAMVAPFAATKCEKAGEIKLCLNRKFEPVDYFARDAYCRSIIDLLMLPRKTHAIIVDWKTGKVKDDFEQIELAAAMLDCLMPELLTFELVFGWVRHRKFTRKSITKADLPAIWKRNLDKANAIEQATLTTNFPAKKSGLCKGYCPVSTCPNWQQKS